MQEGVPPLVALIISQPHMAERLARQHADDGSGHCLSCPSGAQAGRVVYPCTIRGFVDRARSRMRAEAVGR